MGSSAEKAEDPMRRRNEPGMKSPKSLLESGATGGGGHMAAVIRRIEALYQGGRGNASSDEDEEEDEEENSEIDEDDEEEDEAEGERVGTRTAKATRRVRAETKMIRVVKWKIRTINPP